MSCDNLSAPISNLIRRALLLAGRPITGANEGDFVLMSVDFLNQILAEWSTNQIYIPYNSVYKFLGRSDLTYYRIGLGYELDTSPFTVITGVWYEQSGVTIPLQYETYRSFQQFTYKKNVGYPYLYTYELRKDYTEFGVIPKANKDLPMIIYGKQAMLDVTLFTNQTEIPKYMILPLEYALANELIAHGVGRPQPNFQQNYDNHMDKLKAAPQIDTQGDIKPAVLNAGAIIPLGNYWGGVQGGGSGFR